MMYLKDLTTRHMESVVLQSVTGTNSPFKASRIKDLAV